MTGSKLYSDAIYLMYFRYVHENEINCFPEGLISLYWLRREVRHPDLIEWVSQYLFNRKHGNTITCRIGNKCNSQPSVTPVHLAALDVLTELVHPERCWIFLSNCLIHVFCPFVVVCLRCLCCSFCCFSQCWCKIICVRENISYLVPCYFPNNTWHYTSFS